MRFKYRVVVHCRTKVQSGATTLVSSDGVMGNYHPQMLFNQMLKDHTHQQYSANISPYTLPARWCRTDPAYLPMNSLRMFCTALENGATHLATRCARGFLLQSLQTPYECFVLSEGTARTGAAGSLRRPRTPPPLRARLPVRDCICVIMLSSPSSLSSSTYARHYSPMITLPRICSGTALRLSGLDVQY
eukprot:1763252-Rhodomonas_salina.3